MLDQSAGFNANAEWVNYKGAWVIHVVLIIIAKILLDVVPGMQQDTSWTLVNLGYMTLSYIMFHYVTGTPFESNAGCLRPADALGTDRRRCTVYSRQEMVDFGPDWTLL